jgi:membrane-associated phospholipid phosphatase
MAIFVLIICIGRILALVHTPLDVIGGVAAASIGALWYLEDKTIRTRLVKLKSRLSHLQKSKT